MVVRCPFGFAVVDRRVQIEHDQLRWPRIGLRQRVFGNQTARKDNSEGVGEGILRGPISRIRI